MTDSSKKPPLLQHPDRLEILPGVRVTRRIALSGTFATAFLMALGEAGCAPQALDDDADEDENESAQDSTTPDKSPEASKSPKEPSEDEDEGEGEGEGSEDENSDENDEESEDAEDESDEPSEDDADTPKEEPEDEDEDEPEDKDEDEPKDEEPEDTSPLSLAQIIDMVIDDASKLVGDKSIQEAEYLNKVSKLLARLDKNEKVPRISAGHGHNIKRMTGKHPIQVFVLEMSPRAKIPLHDHGNRIGNLIGWRGSATTINYTRVGKDDERGSFMLQETNRYEIKPGTTAQLARVDDNFHVVQAGPQGATMVDFFTYYQRASGTPGEGSRFAQLGQVVDKEKKIYRASYRTYLNTPPAHDFS